MLDTTMWSALCIIILLVELSFQTNEKPPRNQTDTRDSIVILKQSTGIAFKNSNILEGGRVPSGLNDENDHTHDGREQGITKALPNEVKAISIKEKQDAISNSTVKTDKVNSELNINKSTPNISSKIVHNSEQTSSKTNGSTKKAALTANNTLNATTSAKNPTVSTTPKPFKPLRTEHDDGFVVKNIEEHIRKLPNIETYTEKKTKSADYVVPIVAIIFSVPLVAFIISVVYKRGTDWWLHRNYRRMDFLIDGMYNN